MTVEEIFKLPDIIDIEKQILDAQRDIETGRGNEDCHAAVIRELIRLRKKFLDREFVMNGNYKSLLADFNNALRDALVSIRKKAIKIYNGVKLADADDSFAVIVKCFLGYQYSSIHPVQSIRAKKMWAVLNNSLYDYNFHYEDGVTGISGWKYPEGDNFDTENYMLYLNNDADNWNDWFVDKDATKDMNLIHPVHYLLDHTCFSIFDLLWVRDFNVEITVETNYDTYSEYSEYDDLDWTKCDYL